MDDFLHAVNIQTHKDAYHAHVRVGMASFVIVRDSHVHDDVNMAPFLEISK
ncbi:hypothetical protein [Bremerella alba]|uniref:hypothetical protein n=1 Tax=Bremerella alba TaxID=980252 RepID=UPI001A955EA7|nr:hypothetical protein [Bremerella alba]